MSEPSKGELLAAVCHLQNLCDRLHGRYANDVSPNRAQQMNDILSQSRDVSQPLVNRFAAYQIENAMRRYPTPNPSYRKEK